MLSLLALLLLQVVPGIADRAEMTVSGARVVFFGPTAVERDSLVRTEGLEMAEMLDDFDYNAGKASAYLKRRNIPVESTTSPVIVVQFGERQVRRLERRSMPDVFGAILTDGVQEPRLLSGMLTDEELIEEFRDFFRLKCTRCRP